MPSVTSHSLDAIADNLTQDADGVWRPTDRSAVSFPVDGNVRNAKLEEMSFWFRHRSRCIVEAVRTWPPPGWIFDIGGGTGFVSQALVNAGFDTVLVEPDPEAVHVALDRGLTRIVGATFHDAGFKPRSVPAAGLFDVLEHIEDDHAFLGSIGDLLVDEGRLYITVPAYNLLYSNEDTRAGHFRRYTIKSVTGKLRSAGFRIEYATYVFQLLPIPILLFRTIPTRLGIRRHSEFGRIQQEHRAPSRLMGALMTRTFQRELTAIRNKHRCLFGGTCLVVAQVDRP
ncbi:MAG TPA: class I SAM-dependent methyltransferase [Candidatus Hydrogenedentes bacterium]|nr:class I SAM-dependent methyltransferase [Candidatus Hydrogenedentota bacterium]